MAALLFEGGGIARDSWPLIKRYRANRHFTRMAGGTKTAQASRHDASAGGAAARRENEFER